MPYTRRNDLPPLALGDRLWRYMDFTKFVAMLATKTLHLCRIDELGDSFEGALPPLNIGTRRGFFADEHERRHGELTLVNFDERKCYYVNCWHGSDAESDAMWKLYVRGNEGVAIHTTFGRLQKAIEQAQESVWVGKVIYPDDFVWHSMPDDAMFYACMTKRKCFSHESEIRMVWWNEEAHASGRPGERGRAILCDLDMLIEKVVLAPTKHRWFKAIVEDVLDKYCVNAVVSESDLAIHPPWTPEAEMVE